MIATHPFDDKLHEECGVFGIYGHQDAAAHTALGLGDHPEWVTEAKVRPLVERGAALGVSRGEPIEAAIRKLLFDDGVAGELERTRKEYIQEFAFGTDGRSTERIVQAIFDTCKS